MNTKTIDQLIQELKEIAEDSNPCAINVKGYVNNALDQLERARHIQSITKKVK